MSMFSRSQAPQNHYKNVTRHVMETISLAINPRSWVAVSTITSVEVRFQIPS